MKIISIGNFMTGWDGSVCDEEHIAKALEELGHEVYRWQRETTLPGGGELEVPGLEDSSINFILIAQWDGYDGKFVTELRDYFEKTPIVYWAFDYQADGQAWHERLVREADLYLSKPLSDAKYPNWQWLSQDFAPTFLKRSWSPPEPDKDIEVLFTGSYLPWATERLETLRAVDEKYDLHIYSVTADQWQAAGFKNTHGPVMDEGLMDLIPRAKVNLSVDHTITPGYWSDRNAQIMACGGVVLFRYVPLSEATFHDSIFYFYNIEDCLQQIDWLLSQSLMAAEGFAWSFAQNNLMVKNRVQDLLTIVTAKL